MVSLEDGELNPTRDEEEPEVGCGIVVQFRETYDRPVSPGDNHEVPLTSINDGEGRVGIPNEEVSLR